ncbi:MAG: FecR domain-containing protein [Novosphingobium sp.]|nr:FecR domain-containing protein [Novosphingobium sp.]
MTPSPQRFEAGAQSRTIALDDGSTVILAPRSTLEVAGRHQERMALSGGAWFDVRHDPSRALTIEADGVQISDIGTQFDVQAAGGQVRVEVAEGKVEVRSDAMAQPVRLTQGRSLSYDPKQGTALVRPVANNDIGEWRSGRLSFDMAPLTLVAADLSRYAGVEVTVDESLRSRAFSGTLVINNGDAAVRDLTQLMGLGLAGSAGDYRIEPR